MESNANACSDLGPSFPPARPASSFATRRATVAAASDGRTTYPGVGISFGLSRTLVPLLAEGVVSGSRAVPSAVLVALADEESRPLGERTADALRKRGIATEVAAAPQKYGRQIRYAERRGIPFVWFPEREEVRDIRSGVQVAADPAVWIPPLADLSPQVVIEDEEQT